MSGTSPAPLTSTDDLFRPAQSGNFFPWRDTLPLGQHIPLTCAELSRLAYAPRQVIEATLSSLDWDLECLLQGARFLPGQADTEGFVARPRAGGPRFVVFRGTDSGSVDDLLTDLNAIPRQWRGRHTVHRGFADEYDSLCGPLQHFRGGSGDLVLTGHSLGGALATLALDDLPSSRLLTWGAPRVGDQQFVDSLRAVSIERFVHCCDLVARVPLVSLSRESLVGFLRRCGEGLREEGQTAPRLWLWAEKIDPSPFLHAQATRWLGHAPPEYHHPGRLMYLTSQGTLQEEPDESAVREDQRRGREAFRHALKERLPDKTLAREIWKSARQALASLPRGDWTDARRRLVQTLRGLAESNPLELVLIRDFADHAPCHYVRTLLHLTRRHALPETTA
ncbi:MAG: lipase family protein [Planctomycetaceae bacterium]